MISWTAYRKKGREEDYYQVKKAVPVTVLAFSVFATLLSPISFLTLVGNAYTGRSYLWFVQRGIFLAFPLAHRYFLPLYQKENYETVYHLLEDKFQSAGIRLLASGLFILYQLGRIAVVSYLLSQALEPFIPINQLVLSGLLLLLTWQGGLGCAVDGLLSRLGHTDYIGPLSTKNYPICFSHE